MHFILHMSSKLPALCSPPTTDRRRIIMSKTHPVVDPAVADMIAESDCEILRPFGAGKGFDDFGSTDRAPDSRRHNK